MTPIIALLLGPVIICNSVNAFAARLVIVITATTILVSVLAGMTRARTIDLVVAGATYVCPSRVITECTDRTKQLI